MPENKQDKAAHITGKYGIAIAIVTGIFLLLVVVVTQWLSIGYQERGAVKHEPPEATQGHSLAFTKIEPIPQMVNKKFEPTVGERIGKEISGTELSTFRFAVSDEGANPVHVARGEFIVDKVETIRYGITTMALFFRIDHERHVQVFLQDPEVGESIPVSLDFTVSPDSKREFVIWFRSTEHLPNLRNILRLNGRLKLHCESGSTTSKAIEIEIHGDAIEKETNVHP